MHYNEQTSPSKPELAQPASIWFLLVLRALVDAYFKIQPSFGTQADLCPSFFGIPSFSFTLWHPQEGQETRVEQSGALYFYLGAQTPPSIKLKPNHLEAKNGQLKELNLGAKLSASHNWRVIFTGMSSMHSKFWRDKFDTTISPKQKFEESSSHRTRNFYKFQDSKLSFVDDYERPLGPFLHLRFQRWLKIS